MNLVEVSLLILANLVFISPDRRAWALVSLIGLKNSFWDFTDKLKKQRKKQKTMFLLGGG